MYLNVNLQWRSSAMILKIVKLYWRLCETPLKSTYMFKMFFFYKNKTMYKLLHLPTVWVKLDRSYLEIYYILYIKVEIFKVQIFSDETRNTSDAVRQEPQPQVPRLTASFSINLTNENNSFQVAFCNQCAIFISETCSDIFSN